PTSAAAIARILTEASRAETGPILAAATAAISAATPTSGIPAIIISITFTTTSTLRPTGRISITGSTATGTGTGIDPAAGDTGTAGRTGTRTAIGMAAGGGNGTAAW